MHVLDIGCYALVGIMLLFVSLLPWIEKKLHLTDEEVEDYQMTMYGGRPQYHPTEEEE